MVGVILLVLIVIVFLLIIFVVSMRRGDEDMDKYSGDTVSDTLFNVVAASQQQRISGGEREVQACGEFTRLTSCVNRYPSPISRVQRIVQEHPPNSFAFQRTVSVSSLKSQARVRHSVRRSVQDLSHIKLECV